MKRIITTLLMIVILAVYLTGCSFFAGEDDKENPGEDNSGIENPGSGDGEDGDTFVPSDGFLWSKDTNAHIVYDGAEAEVKPLYDHIALSTEKQPYIHTSDAPVGVNEIIVGKTSRELSSVAYSKLDSAFDKYELEESDMSAYYICASGGSIAVAYTDLYARDKAISYLMSFGDSFYIEGTGTVKKESFKTLDFIAEHRNALREEGFKQLELFMNKEAVDIVRKIYTLYDEDLYLWLANLYDPVTGGFYYSESARDTEGFLPDIESTGQALKIIENSGLADLYGGKWTSTIPEDMKLAILNFARGLQSESDGYYYHPQWGTAISSTRRGRDSGWANDIIKSLGEKPYYPTASERDTVIATSAITPRLGSSVEFAVSGAISSQVIATASFSVKSWEALKAYLDDNLAKNSYSVGNTLNSNITSLKKANLWDKLIEYLRTHQFSNGLWEREVSYNAVNGLMKVSNFFGSSFPNADAAIESALEIIRLPASDELSALVFVYNPWVAIYNVLPSCSEESRAKYEKILADSAAELINNTFLKLALFSKPDGGFSMGQKYSSARSQDALVAVENSPESDVNSTSIAISSVLVYMLQVYVDIQPPTLYCKYDTIYFLEELESLGAIIKDDFIVEEPVVETFDDGFRSEIESDIGGVDMNPAYSVYNNVGDQDIDTDGNFKWFVSGIVDNPIPEDPTNPDKVLYSGDLVYDNNGDGKIEDKLIDKEMAIAGSNTQFSILNYGIPGGCYVFESDILCPGANTTAPIAQIQFTRAGTNDTSLWVDLYTYTGTDGVQYLRVQDYFAGRDGIKDGYAATGIPIGEWFKLHLEVYKTYDEESGALSINLKIFVNGEYAGCSDSGYYNSNEGVYYDRIISAVRFAFYRHSASSLYFNNVYAYKSSETYKPQKLGYGEELTLDGDNRVYDFEDGIPDNDGDFSVFFKYTDANTGNVVSVHPNDWTSELETAYGIGTGKGGVRIYPSLDNADKKNAVLKVFTQNVKSSSLMSQMRIDDSVLSLDGKTYELRFDYYVQSIPWLYSGKYFNIGFDTYKGQRLYDVSFEAVDWEETKKNPRGLAIRNAAGEELTDFVMQIGSWYTFTVEYYYNEEDYANSYIKMFVTDKDGNEVCILDKSEKLNKDGIISGVTFEFNPYDIRGTQYLDDISFARTDKEYVHSGASFEGYAHPDKIDLSLKGESSYDFETDSVKVGITGATHSTNKASDDRIDAVQTEATLGGARPSGYYGVFMKLAADPTAVANRVLAIESVKCGGYTPGMLTGKTVKESDTSSVHVIEYDYYFESNTAAASATILHLQFNDNTGSKIGNNIAVAHNIESVAKADKVKKNVWQFGTSSVANCPTDALLNSNTWYTLRVVYDSSKSKENFKLYVSWDMGASFKEVTVSDRSAGSNIDSVSLVGIGYNNTGVQYIDNFSYSVLDNEPEYVKGERPIEPEIPYVPPTAGQRLDFETDTGADVTELYTYSAMSQGTPVLQSSVAETSSSSYYYGVIGSRVTDPVGGANKVMKLVINGGDKNSNTVNEKTSRIILNPSSFTVGGKIHIVEYDFYLERITKNMRNPFTLQAYGADGEKLCAVERNTTDSKYTSNIRLHTPVSGTKVENAFNLAQGTSAGTAESETVAMFDSHTWYRFRITWDQENSQIYYEVSFDGGSNYYLAFKGERKSADVSDENVHHLAFQIGVYSYGAVYYMDNVDYRVTDTLPTLSKVLGNDSVEKAE